MNKVEFSEIVSLFDPNIWDIGYLSAHQMDRAGNTPLKAKFHLHDGFDLTSHIHNTSLNGIVESDTLMRQITTIYMMNLLRFSRKGLAIK